MTNAAPAVVLVIEDDAVTRTLVSTALRNAGLETVEAQDGEEGLRCFFEAQPDLVVLDTVMPGMQGPEVFRRIRDMSELPVLVLSGAGGELELVRALRSGADDYVTKPFGRLELVARVEGLLRRRAGAQDVEPFLSDGLVSVDFAHAAATVGGSRLTLTPLEFRLLAQFVRHPNQVLSTGQLAELVWGEAAGSPDRVKLYVSYLRRKLRDAAAVEPIETVRGFGYRYRPDSGGPGEG